MAKKNTAKKTTSKTTKIGKQQNNESQRKPSGLDLAAQVLLKSKTPLNAGAIAQRVIAAGWKTEGKTPSQTLHAAIGREIKALGGKARFRKAGRGLFAAAKK